MSSDSEYERTATLVPGGPDGAEPRLLAPAVDEAVMAPAPEPHVAPEAQIAAVPEAAAQRYVAPRVRTRPKWVVPVAIAAVGLIASGALGYLFYSTNTKLEATRHTLTNTQLTLDVTKQQLTAAQEDAVAKKVTADYLALYAADA